MELRTFETRTIAIFPAFLPRTLTSISFLFIHEKTFESSS